MYLYICKLSFIAHNFAVFLAHNQPIWLWAIVIHHSVHPSICLSGRPSVNIEIHLFVRGTFIWNLCPSALKLSEHSERVYSVCCKSAKLITKTCRNYGSPHMLYPKIIICCPRSLSILYHRPSGTLGSMDLLDQGLAMNAKIPKNIRHRA